MTGPVNDTTPMRLADMIERDEVTIRLHGDKLWLTGPQWDAILAALRAVPRALTNHAGGELVPSTLAADVTARPSASRRGEPAPERSRAGTMPSEVERLREALTPSGETKAVYIGEFKFRHEMFIDGDEHSVEVTVPWTTVKEIMKAISNRAGAPSSPVAMPSEEEIALAIIEAWRSYNIHLGNDGTDQGRARTAARAVLALLRGSSPGNDGTVLRHALEIMRLRATLKEIADDDPSGKWGRWAREALGPSQTSA